MIEDIQALRQAARLTPDNENQDEKVLLNLAMKR